MSYRDDLDAAHHRAEALEQALELQQRGLARRRGVDWRALAPSLAANVTTGAFAALALTLGWGTFWAIGGFVLFAMSLFALFGLAHDDSPSGVIAVRSHLDVAGRPVQLVAAVRVVKTVFEGVPPPFNGKSPAEIAESVTAILEPVVRALDPGEDPTPAANKALASVGMEIVSIWAG